MKETCRFPFILTGVVVYRKMAVKAQNSYYAELRHESAKLRKDVIAVL